VLSHDIRSRDLKLVNANIPTSIFNMKLIFDPLASASKYCGGAPRRLLNSVDFGGFQRFFTSATRD
jgi:hypothetical protein